MKELAIIIEEMKVRADGYNEIKSLAIDKLFLLLASPKMEIKEAAAKIIASLGLFFNEKDVGNILLTKALSLAHDEDTEENRVIAV